MADTTKVGETNAGKLPGRLETIIKVVAGLSGAAILFLALGFAIVQTFLAKNSIEGMFWLSQEFYTRAGGRFLLDAIKSPFLRPLIFFPYVAILLIAFIPTKENIQKNLKNQGRLLQQKQWNKMAGLAAILGATVTFEFYYEVLIGPLESFLAGHGIGGTIGKIIGIFLFDPINGSLQLNRTVAFFCAVLPVTIAVGVFIHRLGFIARLDTEKHESKRAKRFFWFVVIVYACFLFYLPISYGQNIYDWRIAPVRFVGLTNEAGESAQVPEEPVHCKDNTCLWLLGQFDDKYVFLRKTKDGGTQAILETIDASKLHRLIFEVDPPVWLSDHVRASTDPQLRKEADDMLSQQVGVEKLEEDGGDD